MSTVMNLLFAL